ncbi:peptidoglycan-binding domain-containing protein [Leifsonia sp. 21MFCrub1.1]|uniref:peptidoglycan-binding domain-containing protein n=1 Tax=Leifsonia sp. 21MFCrub1.1 TaxID=1798223 RepID=UPI000B7D6305|nr:peptidoglycan-binding domain-containing protein [Leifsonia sp. 21MFCrub1.1]
MPRLSAPLLVVGAFAVLSLGTVAGAVLVPTAAPQSIASTVRPTSVQATEITTTDEQTATLRVTARPAQKLSSRAAGTITADDCQPGGTVASGSSGPTVNDAVLVHLATSQPLWRDLSVGDTGADVRSLQAELSRLGQPVEVDGRFGAGTLRAVSRMAETAGASDARSWSTLPFARFIWLPAASVVIASCDTGMGQEVAAQGPVATLPQGVSDAVLTPLPDDVMAGDRVVVADGLTIPVDAAGRITSAADLERLAASQAYLRYRGSSSDSGPNGSEAAGPDGSASKPGMSVQYRLAQPTTVFSVPAAAVYATTGSTGCVVDEGHARAVTIVGSQLGETFVVPRDGSRIGSISLDTRKAPRC